MTVLWNFPPYLFNRQKRFSWNNVVISTHCACFNTFNCQCRFGDNLCKYIYHNLSTIYCLRYLHNIYYTITGHGTQKEKLWTVDTCETVTEETGRALCSAWAGDLPWSRLHSAPAVENQRAASFSYRRKYKKLSLFIKNWPHGVKCRLVWTLNTSN